VINDITAVDIEEMNILGYNLATAVVTPEPTSVMLLGLGVASIAGYSWRRRRA
jgi:hypothetical protein